ncbi:uncharacterized protein LOC100906639 [Galendromus occidentalis]|uniref:Uncharacterized protein LOC100906639 n=1 Tax=Galendromus occidentalis TaxID=34638 RepID=A0AAJ6VXS5_9ACAR|nr:uncharacterized protein LOC100906639 [Galendromus occidentalis]
MEGSYLKKLGSLAVLVTSILIGSTSCLRLHHLDVPRSAQVGDSVWLNCTYDLERDDLYAVKWYFNNTEFYRYSNNKADHFDVPGITADRHISLGGNVYLLNVNLQGEGIYKCEATAGSPTFQTVDMEQYLEVYMMPEENPAIAGVKHKYVIGDVVNVTCESAKSKPATRLSWYINDKPAPVSALIPYEVIPGYNGLESSLLGLRFRLDSPIIESTANHFKLSCGGEVRRERLVEQQIRVTRGKGSTSADSNPSITFTLQGDLLSATCIVRNSSDANQVTWYINNRKVESNDTRRMVPYTRTFPVVSVYSEIVVQLSRQDRSRPVLRCVAMQSHLLWNGTKERILKLQTRSAGYFFLNDAPYPARSSTATLFMALSLLLLVTEFLGI